MDQIKLGSAGRSVTVLQYLLGLKPTGIFGDAEDKAVRAFQGQEEIKVDGIAGKITFGKLADEQKTQKKGAVSDAVRAIQTIVGAAADGKFGPQTEAAVRAYQKANGLVADGIVGAITWHFMLTGELITKNVAVQPVDYKQYDSRWRNVMYSRSVPTRTIKNNGCGPTAVSDIVATWWNPLATPNALASLAINNGFCAEANGTYRSFFAYVAERFKASNFIRTTDTAQVKKALLAGAYVIALMGRGFWTGGGHYICLWKYDPALDRIYANDPASSVRKYASAKSFDAERKEYFIFYK